MSVEPDQQTIKKGELSTQKRNSFRWLWWGGTWFVTSLIVSAGAHFGYEFIQPRKPDLLSSLYTADARLYEKVARFGYSYNPNNFSTVAFFPAYPLAGRWLSQLTGLPLRWALLLLSNLCFLGAIILVGLYTERRVGGGRKNVMVLDGKGPENQNSKQVDFTVLIMALFPFTFFFRMAYSEPLFLCCAIVAIWGMVKRWNLLAIALIVGLATATRPVGIALLPPLAWYAMTSGKSWKNGLLRLCYAVPLGLAGLIAYSIFLYVQFGHPLAFAQTQENLGRAGLSEKILMLLSIEPIRQLYDYGSPNYWQSIRFSESWLYSMQFWNGIYWCGAVILIVFGAIRKWLNVYEILLALALLFIPYVTLATEVRMNSHARYAAAVFPLYIVLGRVLSRIPQSVAIAILALSGFLLGSYSALYVADRWFF